MPQVKKFRNKIVIEGSTAYIALKRKGDLYWVMIDTEHLEKVKNFGRSLSWCSGGYAGWKGCGEPTVLLHRYLTEAGEGDYVDHLDSNPANNRLINLSVGTQADNLANLTGKLISNCKHKNISWSNYDQRYTIKIVRSGKTYWNSRNTLEEAIIKRDEMLTELAH